MRHILRLVALASVALLLAPAASGQLRLRSRYILTSVEIARAIAKVLGRGDATVPLPTVQLFADVTASESDPQLEVTAIPSPRIDPSASSKQPRLLFRIACRTSAVCLPFYAEVLGTPSDIPASVHREDIAVAPAKARPQPPTIRSGAHATLFFQAGATRIEMPVICLQNGAQGESIRVAGVDRKHIYTAHVVAATLLQGEF